jgi:hypothetical protein
MIRKSLITITLLVLIFPLSAQSRPIMGYDKVTWGSSVADVKRAYNFGDEIPFYASPDDPNVAFLLQENISENIVRREFYFSNWNSNNYRLYRVVVYYRDEQNSQSIFNSLGSTLSNIYGAATSAYEERGGTLNTGWMGLGISVVTSYVIFGLFEPELQVALVNERYWTQILGLASNIDKNQVMYTWQRFLIAYEAERLGL